MSRRNRTGRSRPCQQNEDRERREQKRRTYAQKHCTPARAETTPEERRRDVRAALKRIQDKTTDSRMSPERVALTVLRGDRAPQVSLASRMAPMAT